jgi:hypothetical protein
VSIYLHKEADAESQWEKGAQRRKIGQIFWRFVGGIDGYVPIKKGG